MQNISWKLTYIVFDSKISFLIISIIPKKKIQYSNFALLTEIAKNGFSILLRGE